MAPATDRVRGVLGDVARSEEELIYNHEVECLRDDLLLKKLKEFELDIHMAEAVHQNGICEPREAKEMVERAIKAVGRKQVIREHAIRVESQYIKARNDAHQVNSVLTNLSEQIGAELGPVFLWAWNVQEKYDRVFGTHAETLLETIQGEANEREEYAAGVQHRITVAQQTSADVLDSLRQIHRNFKREVVKVREQRERELTTTREMWEESLAELLNEDAHLTRMNKEVRFHLKRGSNYKQPLGDAAGFKTGGRTAAPRGGSTTEEDPSSTQEEEIAAEAASSRLSQRKLEEIELAERALQRDRKRFNAVLALVAKRKAEREELAGICEALSREVEHCRTSLSHDAPHPASVRRGVSPSPSTTGRRRAASQTPTRSVRRGVSPAVLPRGQSPSPSPFTPRRRVPFNQSGPAAQPPPPPPRAEPVPQLSTHFVRDRVEPLLQLRTSGEPPLQTPHRDAHFTDAVVPE